MGPNKKRRVPAGPKEVPGSHKGGSRRKASATGIAAGDPKYGINPAPATKNPAARAARITGTTTGRSIPSGQANLERKARRQVQ
jgi:hypothetical protein